MSIQFTCPKKYHFKPQNDPALKTSCKKRKKRPFWLANQVQPCPIPPARSPDFPPWVPERSTYDAAHAWDPKKYKEISWKSLRAACRIEIQPAELNPVAN